ncbi:hypothetical protein PVK06_010608 [Gossypium arboreum]|uniref:Exocyst subunit Exo70 family protein n=1 Tax=Gossypium arboreum TaxID=29729 RepID=A0ABR0Q6K7_GOSAR|nr:hypothetical protein PVK06_010608 [Gossypium arboreum]
MPMCLSSPAEAMTGFIQIIGAAKESMQKFLVNGEFEEYLGEKRMHCTARLAEMLNNFFDDLQKGSQYNLSFSTNFLMDEILVLEEARGESERNFQQASCIHERGVGIFGGCCYKWVDGSFRELS